MEISKSNSIFKSIRSRELNGFRVRKRPLFAYNELSCREIASVAVEHDGDRTPPLAVSFCKSSQNSQILAVSDEDGHVSLFDSNRKFLSSASHQENTEKARISNWIAHHNAVFDLSWIKEDSFILTASGDQTIKVWDVEERRCTGVLAGHKGTVKSLSSHPTNSDLLVSGSRDGSFALWDLRCKSSSCRGGSRINSSDMVNGAHLPLVSRRVRRAKATSSSITSVLYLKDGTSIATAGAPNSAIKFWDVRKLRVPMTQASPHPEPTNTKFQEKSSHGIACLSQDSSGTFLTASCKDNRIYLYNLLRLDKGPLQSFSGCRIDSFFVRTVISPDAAYILSGSSDGNAYIWQVHKPQAAPVILKGHDFEVTAVDWCPLETGKVATASDDFTVRLWNIENTCCPNAAESPSSIKRSVMALSSNESRKPLMDNEPESPGKRSGILSSFNEDNAARMPINIRTPETQKKTSSSDSEQSFKRTPEAALNSPSSVLNPPPSVKRRTIRDYFLVSP